MSNNSWVRLLRAGIITAIVDGLWAVVLGVGFRGSTFERVWQGVASVLLGPSALEGGTRTMWIGLAMHVCVAFFWSGVFLLATRSVWIQRVLNSPGGYFKIAAWYGPLIWIVMSCVVIPVLVKRPPRINLNWLIQALGHIVFVGLPIVASIGRSREQKTS